MVDAVAVRATLAHARVLLKLGRKERARALLLEARESAYSMGDLTTAIDEELRRAA